MKKLLNIGLFALILVFFTTQIVSAQYSSGLNPAVQSPNGAMLVQFKSVLDSLDENYSKPFSVTMFDGDLWTTYPIFFTKKTVSAAGKPFSTTMIQGSNDKSNWVTIDTVGAAKDSVETLMQGSLDLNSKKFLYYREYTKGEAGNRSDTVVETTYYFYRKK